MLSVGDCEKICKDEDYKEIRKRLNTFYDKEEKKEKDLLNKIIRISCKNGQLEILRYIYDDLIKNAKKHLKFEKTYWYRKDRTCLLQVACRKSNIEIVRYLLSIGISIGIDSNRINNALEVCMDLIQFERHDWNCATLLLENGGDVNLVHRNRYKTKKKGLKDITLLSIACIKRNYEMVQNLCEKYSAKINEYSILYCFDDYFYYSPIKYKIIIDEGTKIAEFLIRKCDIGDIDKILKLLYEKYNKFEIDDYIFKKVMDMVVKEQKRRKQENIRNLLLIGCRKRPELHQDELREIASFF